MNKLTSQEKTILRCCVHSEILELEKINLSIENSTKPIDIDNYEHNKQVIDFMLKLSMKIKNL